MKERPADATVYLYRYNLQVAHFMGVHEHPEIVIRRYFPAATDLEPAAVIDCWYFRSPAVQGVPEYFERLRLA